MHCFNKRIFWQFDGWLSRWRDSLKNTETIIVVSTQFKSIKCDINNFKKEKHDESGLKTLRAQLAILLSPSLNRENRNFFSLQATKAVEKELGKIDYSISKSAMQSIKGRRSIYVSENIKVGEIISDKKGFWLKPHKDI